MAAKKGLDIADFPTIFQSLTSGRRTGTLKVSTDTGALFFYFRDGIIRHFAQPARDDVLLRAMLRSSKIDRLEYDRLLSRHQRGGRSYHSLFSAKRSLTDADMQSALQFMVQEEVCDLFARSRLDCEFFEGNPMLEVFGPEKQRVDLSVMPEVVVMEAARRMDEIAILRETVPSMSNIYIATGLTEEQIEGPLPPDDAHLRNEVLDLIDGRRDLNEIAELVRMSKFDLLRTVAQLVGARIIESLGGRSLLTLAQQHAIEGDIRKALRLYERAEELGETQMDTRMHIARLYGALCDQKRAVAKYLSIAEDAANLNDTEGGISALRQAVHVDPERTEVREQLVTCLLQSDRYDEAINESIELANLLLKLREIDRAVRAWQSFMDKYPTSTEAHRQLAELHKEQDNKSAAIQTLDSLAELYLARAQRDKAAEVYREILELDSKHTRVRLKLASVLRRIGNIAEAAKEYESFRSTTRLLKLSERPQTLFKSWLGFRHPAVLSSARLALGGFARPALAILSLSIALAGILTLALAETVSSADVHLSVKVGAALFEGLVTLQVVLLLGALAPLASASVLFHPHEDKVSVAAQLAMHPRAAVAGKFIGTLTAWLILLSSTLPIALAVASLGGVGASIISFNYYLFILLGAVTSAALTLVSANVPDRRLAVVDSYLVCAILAFLGMLFVSMLSEVTAAGGRIFEISQISLTDIPLFQFRTLSFAGTVLLMPIATVFLCGFMLMGAAARLMPEKGYSSPSQKLFWFIVIILGTITGLVWASAGARASSLSQPSVAQLLLFMSIFLALSLGAVVFPVESASVSARDREQFKRLFLGSRFRMLLGPGAVRGGLFVLSTCAIVIFILLVTLSLSESSPVMSRLSGGVIASVYFAVVGCLGAIASLGVLLSTTTLAESRRRVVLVITLGVILAVIPSASIYLGNIVPRFIAELSPLTMAAATVGRGLTIEEHPLSVTEVHWVRVAAFYWVAAAVISSVAFFRIRKSGRTTESKGRTS